MAKHYKYWESYLPFDGIVVPINQERYAGRYGSTTANILPPTNWPLNHVAFNHRKIHRSEYQHVVDDLKSCKFTKFKHNFLNLTTYPHLNFAMDWFDDKLWDRLLHNVGVLAWVAKNSGCKGIWFDTEQYGPPNIWHWKRLQTLLPHRAADFDTYRAKVTQRGAQFIRTINREFPQVEMVLSFGNCLIHEEVVKYKPLERKNFSHARNILIAPFLDGLMRAADAGTSITDAFELSYYYQTEEQFEKAARIVRQACRAYSLNPFLYTQKIQVGFGLFPTRQNMFSARDFTSNRLQPGDLRKVVRFAMKHTDKYVWIWNERVSFWIKGGPDGKPLMPLQPFVDSDNRDVRHLTAKATPQNALRPRDIGLPQIYLDAIAQGKRDALAK